MKSKLDQIIDFLRTKGYSQEKVDEFVAQINDMGYQKFYSEAMALFTQKDFDQIKECINQMEANEKIREIYYLRSGKDPSVAMREFVEMFAEGFLTGSDYTQAIKQK